MRYTKINIEFTTTDMEDRACQTELQYILLKIKAKEILKLARNVEIQVYHEDL